MASTDDMKALSQQRFGQHAEEYVTSSVHAKGKDLDRLVELANPQLNWSVLDIATGGGHTALRFAPHVRRVTAADLTPGMLEAARRFISQQGVQNVTYAATDAEGLAFTDGTFDLVTCRIAPHHFPDVFRFVQECVRVLKPGGRLVIQDHVLPEDDQAARYIDAFERLRDPSHHRAFAEYEWRGMFLDAGLAVEQTETFIRNGGKLLTWAERQGCTLEIIQKLQLMLVQAPEAAKTCLRPRYLGTDDAEFDHNYIIILGRKPA